MHLWVKRTNKREWSLPERCKLITLRIYGQKLSPFTWRESQLDETPLIKHWLPKGDSGEKKSEGLTQGCLAKGSKVGTGGKVAKMMVAISRGKAVVICATYEKMDVQYFASFIDRHFDAMFERSGKRSTRLWRQDGDPSRNSKTAREAMGRCNSELLKIPPRSPDLNPIEKTFNIVSQKLEKMPLREVLHVNHVKSFVIGCREQNGRIAEIIRNNGERLKY